MTTAIRANTTTIAGTLDNLPICQLPITFHISKSNTLDHINNKGNNTPGDSCKLYVYYTYVYWDSHSCKILLTSIALNQFQNIS